MKLQKRGSAEEKNFILQSAVVTETGKASVKKKTLLVGGSAVGWQLKQIQPGVYSHM